MEGNGLSTGSNFSRRSFLTHASQWSALIAAYPLFPVSDLAGSLARDSRVAQTPVVDKGFASVRKVGDGLYATISDTSRYRRRLGPECLVRRLRPTSLRPREPGD